MRIVPISAHHHNREVRADTFDTEEVSYIDGPDDLSEAPDPAHDPSASEDDTHEGTSTDADIAAKEDLEESAPANEGEDSPAAGEAEDENLTPLPGFDAEPKKPQKKTKRQRASIPSWDDIVFGHKD